MSFMSFYVIYVILCITFNSASVIVILLHLPDDVLSLVIRVSLL